MFPADIHMLPIILFVLLLSIVWMIAGNRVFNRQYILARVVSYIAAVVFAVYCAAAIWKSTSSSPISFDQYSAISYWFYTSSTSLLAFLAVIVSMCLLRENAPYSHPIYLRLSVVFLSLFSIVVLSCFILLTRDAELGWLIIAVMGRWHIAFILILALGIVLLTFHYCREQLHTYRTLKAILRSGIVSICIIALLDAAGGIWKYMDIPYGIAARQITTLEISRGCEGLLSLIYLAIWLCLLPSVGTTHGSLEPMSLQIKQRNIDPFSIVVLVLLLHVIFGGLIGGVETLPNIIVLPIKQMLAYGFIFMIINSVIIAASANVLNGIRTNDNMKHDPTSFAAFMLLCAISVMLVVVSVMYNVFDAGGIVPFVYYAGRPLVDVLAVPIVLWSLMVRAKKGAIAMILRRGCKGA